MQTALATRERSRAVRLLQRQWVLVFLLLEVILFSTVARGFLTVRGMQIIFFFGTSIFLLGTAETFVIVTGGIDLSVGFVMGFASIVAAKLSAALTGAGMAEGPAILLAVAATLIIGLVPGLVNGFLVSGLKVPPFIATFSMLGITHGVSELLIEGVAAKNVPYLANVIGNGHLFYFVPGRTVSLFQRPEVGRGVPVVELIPNTVVITFVFIAAAAFLLRRTRFGLHVYAIGGSIDAAQRAGVPVRRRLIAVYALSSFFASLAGVIYMLQYVTGKADAGAPFLLDAIAAVVIGGASLSGGSGAVGRTLVGCLVIATLETGLRILGVPTFDKYILVGLILIGAVLIDQFVPEPARKED